MADDFIVGWLDFIGYRVSPAPSVAAQPLVKLREWRVIQDASVTKHLYGRVEGSQKQRMTTAIQHVDLIQRKWVTSSGRVYLTHDVPAQELDVEILAFLALHHRMNAPLVDVTSSIWTVMHEVLQ